MVTKKKYVSVFTAFMFLMSLAMVNVPAQPSPPTFYVDQPLGYIPPRTPGTTFWIDIYVIADDLVYNSMDAIVGWGLYVQVDPTVLKPLRVRTSTAGYFLYDFTAIEWYPAPSAISSVDATTGIVDVTEQILSPEPIGGAATGENLPAPYLLVSIQYESLSLFDSTEIDIFAPEYMDAYGTWHAVVDGDGYYQGEEEIPVEAVLSGRKAWPEHHHFDRSKSGDPSVPDAHDSPGNQTFYAKVKNTGEASMWVRAIFRLEKGGVVEPMLISNEVFLDPGEIATVRNDAKNFTVYDDGKWTVTAYPEWQYDPYGPDFQTNLASSKTSKFTVVP